MRDGRYKAAPLADSASAAGSPRSPAVDSATQPDAPAVASAAPLATGAPAPPYPIRRSAGTRRVAAQNILVPRVHMRQRLSDARATRPVPHYAPDPHKRLTERRRLSSRVTRVAEVLNTKVSTLFVCCDTAKISCNNNCTCRSIDPLTSSITSSRGVLGTRLLRGSTIASPPLLRFSRIAPRRSGLPLRRCRLRRLPGLDAIALIIRAAILDNSESSSARSTLRSGGVMDARLLAPVRSI